MVTKPLNQPHQPLEEDPEVGQAVALPPPPQDTEPSPPPPTITAERSGPAWRVLLYLSGPQANTIGLDVWRVTVVGRADPMTAIQPDLDLTPYGAMRHGVSRRHASIRPSEDMLFLVDQHSTNGTWVNGQRLSPGRDFPLSDGDTIELGALRMTMRIVHTPEDSRDGGHIVAPGSRRRRFGWPR